MIENILAEYRTRRETLGANQAELARESGISLSYLTLMESGERTNPTLGTLVKINEALIRMESAAAEEKK